MSSNKYETIVTQVNGIIEEYDMKLTIRQIYYRLVADYGRRNDRNSYGSLVKMLVKAREQNDVDYRRIEDRAREVIGGDFGSDSVQEFIEDQITDFVNLQYYNRKLWADQEKYIEIWVEKDALSAVMASVARPLRVTTAPSRGYASFTYIMDAVNRFPPDKEIIILHFTDHDPSGLDMTADLENRLNSYSGQKVTVKRIALTIEQVRKRNLISSPTKSGDSRSADYNAQYGHECWELDAIKPDELTKMVDDAIKAEMDIEVYNEAIKLMKADRETLESKMSEAEETLRELFGEFLNEEADEEEDEGEGED